MDDKELALVLGGLQAIVQRNCEDIAKLREEIALGTERNTEALKKVEDSLSAYRTVVGTLKAVGAIVVLALTLKFGDIKEFFFKG